MGSLALSLLLCLAGAPRATAAETEMLRPLEIDLRRLYPALDPRWDRIESGGFRRSGARYRPASAFLAAAAAPASQPAAALPRQADGVFLLRRGRVSVEQRLIGAAGAPAVAEKGLLRYPNAYPQTEALYLTDGAGVERFFLLTGRRAPTTFASEVRVAGGTLGAVRSEGLAVYDREGRRAMRFSAPRVLDATGRERRATWTVKGGAKGRYTVELGFDPAGLVYPVLVR